MLPPHNARRGEIAARFNNKDYRLCLTLGALAELESRFNAGNLLELAERFSNGNLKSSDLIAVLGAGLRPFTPELTDEALMAFTHEEGAVGFAKTAVALLELTFGGGASSPNTRG